MRRKFNKISAKTPVSIVRDKLPLSKAGFDAVVKGVEVRRKDRITGILKSVIGDDWQSFYRKLKRGLSSWSCDADFDVDDGDLASQVCAAMPSYLMKIAGADKTFVTAEAVCKLCDFVFEFGEALDVREWLEKRYELEKTSEKVQKSDLRPLLKASVSAPQTADEFDEIAAKLFDETPWMSQPLTAIWKAARERAGTNMPLPPILLHGPPGWGKSTLARRFAELCQRPSVVIDAGAGGAAFRIAGTEKGWSTSQPGVPVETMLSCGIADPVMIVDEIDKISTLRSEGAGGGGALTSLANALLPLLEPGTAAAWQCPYYRVRLDMRRVSWILTANDLLSVPAPLRDRCITIHCPKPDAAGVAAAAAAIARRAGIHDYDDVGRLIASTDPKSLRAVSRLVERLKTEDQAPLLN